MKFCVFQAVELPLEVDVCQEVQLLFGITITALVKDVLILNFPHNFASLHRLRFYFDGNREATLRVVQRPEENVKKQASVDWPVVG